MDKLFPFQAEALDYVFQHKRALLALDCGLGKTRICIELARKLGEKLTVICPAYLSRNWQSEVQKWGFTGEFEVYSYDGSRHLDERHAKGILVIDEAHYCKNWEARRTKRVLLAVAPKFSRVVMLTATPLVKSAADLHPLVSTCEPGKWGKFRDFCEKYCNKKRDAFDPRGFKWVGVKNSEILRSTMAEFTLIKKKEAVMSQLPEKTIEDFYLDITNGAYPNAAVNAQVHNDIEAGFITEAVKTERERIGRAKVRAIAEVADNISGDTSVVVFAHHRTVLSMLGEILGCPVIDGDTPMATREQLITGFQEGEFTRLVASIGACGTGVNLHRASTALFAEMPWTAAEFKQCCDRLHRIGQKNAVTIYRCLVDDTIDTAILHTMHSKARFSADVGVVL